MNLEDHPISRFQWMDCNRLRANGWNPNIVQQSELTLLKFSVLKGWVQPILVSDDPLETEGVYEVIDGYHRWTLTKTDPEVFASTGGMVPVVVMNLSVPERMLLTVRINRAKGSHAAFKMHEIVYSLHHEHGYPIEQICEGIGADKFEVNTLLMRDVFEKKDVARIPYSKSWTPDLSGKRLPAEEPTS